MSVVDFSVHRVTKVEINNRMLSTGVLAQIIRIEYTDYYDQTQECEITLYAAGTKPLVCNVPEEPVAEEVPPALEAEIERDTQAAIGMAKVMDHVFDTLLSPRTAK